MLSVVLVQAGLFIPFNVQNNSSSADCPNSAFVSITPTTMIAGDDVRVTVKFRNSGKCVWKKGEVKLYAVFNSSPSGAQWTEGIARKFGLQDNFPGYEITQDIAVGGTATFSFIVQAFPSNGNYKIRYQLVKKPRMTDLFGAYKVADFRIMPGR
jgi:hypothetical protein